MNQIIKRSTFLKSTISLGSFFFIPSWLRASQELPNVMIIGDSISMGYTPFVKDMLIEKANVMRPNENCGPTERGVAKLNEWLGDRKYKVIYFNFGLHDLKHVDSITKAGSLNPQDPVLADIPTYIKNLGIIVDTLKATGANLVFATTTPVPVNSGAPLREPEMLDKYNVNAKEVMKVKGVEVDDLYSFALLQNEKIQIPNNVHFTKEGSEILAKHIATTIGKYL